MRSLLFCFVVLVSKLLVVSSGANADYEIPCVDNGLCINCGKYEMMQDYCRETGRKISTACTQNNGKVFNDYRACAITTEEDQIRVIAFQFVIALIGAAAYYVVQARKQQTMYDSRKQRHSSIF